MQPEREGLEPSYEQRKFPVEERRDRLQVVASPDGREGSLVIRQDASLYLGTSGCGAERSPTCCRRGPCLAAGPAGHSPGRWPFPVGRGRGVVLDEPLLSIEADEASEVLVFDLA